MKKELIYDIFSNLPTLMTKRLILRRMLPSDAQDMFDYAKRAEVTKYLTWHPHPDLSYTTEYLNYLQTRYAAGDFYDWAVTLRDSGKMIGSCGFTRFDTINNSAEIGYVINPDFRGLGLAAEAARAVIKFGFKTLNLHRIEARHMIGNDASHRVMEKLGMKTDALLREAYYVHGTYRTVTVCSLLRSEYEELKNR